MNIILKVLNKGDCWPILFLVSILLFFFESVFYFPKPAHIIMREHDTFGVGGGSTGIKKIAAHSRLLFNDPLDDDSVVNIFSKFKELSPIVNFDTPKIGALLRFLPGTSSLSSENISEFTENNSYLHPKLNQSFFIYKVFFLQSLP